MIKGFLEGSVLLFFSFFLFFFSAAFQFPYLHKQEICYSIVSFSNFQSLSAIVRPTTSSFQVPIICSFSGKIKFRDLLLWLSSGVVNIKCCL